MNLAVLIGNLTRDPEMRFTGNGHPVTNFDVAVSKKYKNKNDEWVDDTQFIPVTVWGKQAESCDKYLSKGKKVAVTGEMTIREYEAKDGSKRKAFQVKADRVEFLTPKGQGQATNQQPQQNFTETETDIPF